MNFSFNFNSKQQKDNIDESTKNLSVAVESYKKAVHDGVAQYNETRKRAEEHINNGTRITKHRINL